MSQLLSNKGTFLCNGVLIEYTWPVMVFVNESYLGKILEIVHAKVDLIGGSRFHVYWRVSLVICRSIS